MGRGIAAVAAGFLAMSMLVVATTLAVGRVLAPEVAAGVEAGAVSTSYLTLNLLYSALFAVLGGYVTARLAVTRRWAHVLALAGVLAMFGAAGALAGDAQAGQPVWYAWAITALGVAGVLGGGALRLR